MNSLDETYQAFANCVVVLFEPQDDINIGNTIRACKNFGFSNIRLVRPASADPSRVAISAPKAQDLIARLEVVETVEEALADCVQAFALTARQRRAKSLVMEPRGAALQAMQIASSGQKVAFLFGREDFGLPNEVVDHCHFTITIPTNPHYSSLNLGQAVLLIVWELFRAGQELDTQLEPHVVVQPSSDYPAIANAQLDRLCNQAEEALDAIGFFKAESTHHIMRTIRFVFQRAQLDTREAALWHGIFKEMVHFLRRTGRDPNVRK